MGFYSMRNKILLMVLLTVSFLTQTPWAGTVQFKSLDLGTDGNPKILTGKLTKPKGEAPFPAVVLLHGSGGIKAGRDADWAAKLSNWGYVALQVDSFGPRGVSVADILRDSSKVPHYRRAKDAHGALRYLARLPFVDRDRIAVMGWSHGGGATIVSVMNAYGGDPFKAAIAFYPYCAYSMDILNAPLLILTGEADDWCPARKCANRMPFGKTENEVTLKIYPGAYHDFDWKGMNKVVKGHRVRYNPEAAADAIVQVKNYLAQHLK